MDDLLRPKRTANPFGSVSYLCGGTLAVITSWAMATLLSGCRIGNHTSSSEPVRTLTGYYGAGPQALEFCATTSGTTCAAANTSKIPSLLSHEISNPVALIVQDETTGDAALTAFDGNGTSALPIWIAADGVTLYYANSTYPSPLWLDPSCTTTLYLNENGAIVAAGAGQSVPGTNALTKGSLTLKVQVTQTFDGVKGACSAELQAMSDCYQDVSRCGGTTAGANVSLQGKVQRLFETYIQAGVIRAADIPSLTNVAYEVRYQ